MDNITHSLAGWALGEAGLKTKTRKGLAALILAANMPDLDVFTQWAPWTPLATHRGFTHSLIGGVLLMPPILFGLLLLLDRWQMRRGTSFKSGLAMNRGWLLALCYLGALSHPLLDLQTSYSVQLFSPLSGRWYHSDSLFIIDIWLWLLIAGAIAWSKWRKSPTPVQWALVVAAGYICFNLGLSDTAAATVRERDSRAECDFRLAAAAAILEAGLELAPWRHGRPRKMELQRRPRADPMGCRQHGGPGRSQRDPPRPATAQVPRLVDPSGGRGEAQRLHRAGDDRRCALRPSGRQCRQSVAPGRSCLVPAESIIPHS